MLVFYPYNSQKIAQKAIFIFLFLIFVFLTYPFFVLALDKIDINTASLEQLDELTGIGSAYAQRIIDARPFSSVDDLIRVSGIGEKTLQKIKNQGLAYVENQVVQPIIETPPVKEKPTETTVIAELPLTYSTGVIINEILPSPEGADDQNEWIELYNTNNFEVDLSGWKIKDKEGATKNYSLPKNTKISAYGYLIFKRPKTKITLNNTTDGLFLYWPNEKIVDSMTFEKAPINQSYNKIGTSWQWSVSLTPGTKNIILQNNKEEKIENLPKIEKSGNSKEIDINLVAISQSINQEEIENTNPWFLFLTALAITIFSAIIVLFIKFKFQKHVRT